MGRCMTRKRYPWNCYFRSKRRSNMYPSIKYFFILWIAKKIQADDLIYEYFVKYKLVTRITKFSCGETDNDYNFVKGMSGLGIYATIHHPHLDFYNASTSRIIKKDYRTYGLLLDSRCQSREVIEKIIAQATEYRLYEGIQNWLILTSSLNEMIQLLDDSAYSLQTELTVAVEKKNGYDLYDIYNPCKIRGGNFNLTTLGSWDSNNGFNVTLTQHKFTRRSNLMGIKLKVASVVKYRTAHSTVEEYLEDFATRSLDPISKYGWAIATQIAELFNYTMEVYPYPEVFEVVNGTEEGMMAMLDRGEVDIGTTPSSVTLQFAAKPYARMLVPGYPYRSFFIFRSMNSGVFKWLELVTPFALDAWTATVLTAILAVFIITSIQITEYGEGWIPEMGHAIFALLGALTGQGLTFVPNRLAGRIAFLFLLFLGVLQSNYYSASVVSSLLNGSQNKMNDSLYSLAKSRMTVTSEPSGYIDDYLEFKSNFDWEYHYFYEKVWSKLPSSKYVPVEEGLLKVSQGGYAYHTSVEVAYPYIEENWNDEAICEMTEVHVIEPRILCFWERVDNPFTEIVKIGLLKTTNVGLRSRTIKRWKPRTPYCSEEIPFLSSITFNDVALAVTVVWLGAVISIFICYAEIIMFRLQPVTSDAPTKQKKIRAVGKKTLQRQ